MHSRFFFQAEDGIRDLVRSRGLGDVYKRQVVQRTGLRRCDRLNRADLVRVERHRPGRLAILGLSLIHI